MKQTEIGLIPDDWEVKRLSEFGYFCKGSGISREESNTGELPAVRYGEIYTIHNDYIKSFKSHISNEVASKSKRLKQGDLLFTCSGETKEDIGKCVAFIGNEKAYAGGDLLILSPTINIDSLFYGFFLNTNISVKQKSSMAQGDAIVHISTESIGKILVPLPPLAEQKRIAKALSDVDALISTIEKLVQKKKNIKQGTMQNLLTGKKRLPAFAKSGKYKQSELGLIPEDWEVKNINKECTIKARIGWQGLKSTEYLDSGDYILITGTDFDSGFINWKSCSYVTKWRFDQDKNIQIKKGDVLVTKDGTIGKIAFLDSIPMQGTLNSGVFVVRPKNNDKIDSVFLSLIFKSVWFDSFLEQITSGSTIVHLYQKDFVKFDFPLPSKEEQTAIANVLSSMDKEIESLNAKLEKYRKLKTAMMQQLLTGKIRL